MMQVSPSSIKNINEFIQRGTTTLLNTKAPPGMRRHVTFLRVKRTDEGVKAKIEIYTTSDSKNLTKNDRQFIDIIKPSEVVELPQNQAPNILHPLFSYGGDKDLVICSEIFATLFICYYDL